MELFRSVLGCLVAALAVTASSAQQLNLAWNSLSTTTGRFYPIPLTTSSNGIEQYVQVPSQSANGVNFQGSTWCLPDDPRVCIMYDVNNYVVGLQVSFLNNDTSSRGVDLPDTYYAHIPMMFPSNLMGLPAYAAQMFFANPEGPNGPVRTNLGQSVDGVWVYLSGQWIQLARNESNAEANGFTRQSCWPMMGQHYFYQVTPSLQCSNWQGIFTLYEQGQLVGYGLVPFGSFSVRQRNWFENPSNTIVEAIVPNRPECFTQLNSQLGMTSIHVYFIEEPWNINCNGYNTSYPVST